MRNGLLLTLKELIKLGIIKLKKRRKNKNKRLQQIEAFEKAVNDAVPINPQNKRYKYSYPEPVSSSFQVNSDALRVRDDNARLNVQMIENKNYMENQQKLIDDQQLRFKELEYDVDVGRQYLRKYGGFSFNDNIGTIPSTDGSDSFDAQTRQEPRSFIPQTIESPRSSIWSHPPLQDYKEQTLYETPFKDVLAKEEDFAQDDTELIGGPFRTQPSDDEEEEKFIEDNPIIIKNKMKGSKLLPNGKLLLQDGTIGVELEDGTFIPEKKSTITHPSGTERPSGHPSGIETKGLTETKGLNIVLKKKIKENIKSKPQTDVPLGQKTEEDSELKPMNFPNIPVPRHNNYPFKPEKIPYAKSKPSVSELEQWKEFYLTERLNDPLVLEMNTRSGYIKPLLAKLLDDYKKIRGEKDPNILKSKDPREVFKAIKQRVSGGL